MIYCQQLLLYAEDSDFESPKACTDSNFEYRKAAAPAATGACELSQDQSQAKIDEPFPSYIPVSYNGASINLRRFAFMVAHALLCCQQLRFNFRPWTRYICTTAALAGSQATSKPTTHHRRSFFFFFILRRMGKHKALPHHTST